MVRLLRREGYILHVSDLDILDDTPLLDIKPYVPEFDAWTGRVGWLDAAPAPRPTTTGASGASQGPEVRP